MILVLPILLWNCETENQETAASNDEDAFHSTYQLKEGELIHWEAEMDGNFILIKAWLDPQWNTYSVFNTNFIGPLPTLITFEKSELYELVGAIEEVGLKTKYDEESEGEIGYFKDKAVFRQKIKPISGEEFALKGNVNYMICNSTKCLPPEDFSFELIVKP